MLRIMHQFVTNSFRRNSYASINPANFEIQSIEKKIKMPGLLLFEALRGAREYIRNIVKCRLQWF